MGSLSGAEKRLCLPGGEPPGHVLILNLSLSDNEGQADDPIALSRVRLAAPQNGWGAAAQLTGLDLAPGFRLALDKLGCAHADWAGLPGGKPENGCARIWPVAGGSARCLNPVLIQCETFSRESRLPSQAEPGDYAPRWRQLLIRSLT